MNKKYIGLKYHLLAAFFAALYITLFGQVSKIGKALLSLSFYLSVVVSFGLALLMINLVDHVWKTLDIKYSWQTYRYRRLMLQIICGIISPLLVDLLLIAIYFGIFGQNIFTNGFITTDFKYVVYFILLLNFLYAIRSSSIETAVDSPDVIPQPSEIALPSNEQPDTVENEGIYKVESKGSIVALYLTDILCFYSDGRKVHILTYNKGEYITRDTINEIATTIKTQAFCQINRKVIINIVVVKGYSHTNRRSPTPLIIKQKYQPLFTVFHAGELTVTNKHISDFRSAFDHGTGGFDVARE